MRTLRHNPSRGESALTLVEMLVASSLLVVIMLGLTMMFNQTQRAFRSGLKQVDVFEGGRAVADLIARDVESLNDTETPGIVNFAYLDFTPAYLVQANGSYPRTNLFHGLFGQTQVGSDWVGTGYCFRTNKVDGLMDLYRFTMQTNTPRNTFYPAYRKAARDLFRNVSETNVHRVAEGIIHLKVRTFNRDGIEIAQGTNFLTFPFTNSLPVVNGPPIFETNYVPSSVEIELGILEPQTLEQAKSVADARSYLQRQAGKVHIFRQTIPIRNAPR